MGKLILSVFLAGFLVISIFPDIIKTTSAEPSVDLPTANTNISNLVPLDIVKKIALKKAKDLWGQVVPGEPIPCCDQDGNIAYYMCPFGIGKETFPSYDEILLGIRKGRKMHEDLEKGLYPKESVEGESPGSEQTIAPTPSQNGPVGGKSGLATGKPKGPSYQEALKAVKKKELGIGEYGTIYVASVYDRFPIPLVSHYLAPFYLTGDLALEKAKETLGGTPKLNRIYFLGERGTYFEFVSGNKAVTIHAYSLKIEPVKRIDRRGLTPENQERIKEHWDRFIKDSVEGGGSQ